MFTRVNSAEIDGLAKLLTGLTNRRLICAAVQWGLRALSTLRGLRGAPEVPPLCRETQSLGQQMSELNCENATVGTNGFYVLFYRWRGLFYVFLDIFSYNTIQLI